MIIQDRLIAERKALTERLEIVRRQIGKIKGKRKFPDASFILGDTWAASDYPDWLSDQLDRELTQIAKQEAWNQLSPEDRKHRLILKQGWHLTPTRITQPPN